MRVFLALKKKKGTKDGFALICIRYNKLLLYMGLPLHEAKEMRINQFCKVISEFALEYRTTRDKVLHMLEKKANQRERKKTRGKMIHEVSAQSQRRINFRLDCRSSTF